MDVRKVIPIFLSISLFAQCVQASRIQIGVSMQEKVTGGNITMVLTAANSGDEPANDVQLSLLLPDGFSSAPIQAGMMEPNRPFSGEFAVIPVGSPNPGIYPVVLKTRYTDANTYPFSTVSPAYLKYGSSTPTMLRGHIGNLSLSGQNEEALEVSFDNLDEKPHDVLVRLRIPDEIKAQEDSKVLTIGPKDSGKAVFRLKSFGALPDSGYIVFASGEYDDGGLHYSSVASGMIRIVREEDNSSFQAPTWLPAAALVLLVAVVIIWQVKR